MDSKKTERSSLAPSVRKTEHTRGWFIEPISTADGLFYRITGHVNSGLKVPPELSYTYPTKDDAVRAIHKYHGELR